MANLLTKAENNRVYWSGGFGNKLRTWETLEELRDTGFSDKVMMRSGIPASARCYPDLVGWYGVVCYLAELALSGVNIVKERFNFNEQAPDHHIILQGECWEDPSGMGLRLTYSTVKQVMRKALRQETRRAEGLTARLLLREVMDEPSHENLWRLLGEYPEHTVEFSCYERGLGNLGWNTLFWEVRKY